MDIGDRTKKVLQAVIDSYILTGAPVGSQVLAKRYDFSVSSATLRNIMSELEELGLLTHPHTSAGRVPTEKGYRYYIDSLISVDREDAELREQLSSAPAFHEEDMHLLMEEASQFLAKLSRHAGVVVAPLEREEQYKHVEFVRLRGRQVLIIFVTEAGTVLNKLVEFDDAVTQQELNAFSGYLDRELEARSLADIRQGLAHAIAEDRDTFTRLLEQTYQASRQAREREGEKVYIGGASQVLDAPEFADIEIMRTLFKAFEDKYKLLKLLDKTQAAEGIKVFIGSENPYFAVQGCSMVVGSYGAGNVVGTLGVIGPVRMQYRQVIQVVDYTSKLLSRLLGERLQRGIAR